MNQTLACPVENRGRKLGHEPIPVSLSSKCSVMFSGGRSDVYHDKSILSLQ